MSILGVQIVAILFAVFMSYVTFLHFKRHSIKTAETFFWFLLWIGFITITLFPKILESISQLLFFARVMDLLMIIAFMILAFLGFENYISNKKMEKKIEELVRNDSLKILYKEKLRKSK